MDAIKNDAQKKIYLYPRELKKSVNGSHIQITSVVGWVYNSIASINRMTLSVAWASPQRNPANDSLAICEFGLAAQRPN